jgi:hypothetical protein
MRSHFSLGRGVLIACAAGATAGPLTDSFAQVASDSPNNAAYNDGWQPGDNGGFGFGAWNMDGTYTSIIQHSLDDGLKLGTQASSQHNDLGKAWTLHNPAGPTPSPEANDGTDISRAGRALLTPLQVGQTVSVTVDNPTERNFFRGWTIRLITGGANLGYAGDNPSTPVFDPGSISSRLNIGTFEYFTYGRWFGPNGNTSLFDTDTNDGLQIDVTLTGVDSYALTMTSPGNAPYMTSGALAGPAGASIDWIGFDYYGTDSDTYPILKVPRGETDLYISNMQVIPEPGSLMLLTAAGGMTLGRRRPRARPDPRWASPYSSAAAPGQRGQ